MRAVIWPHLPSANVSRSSRHRQRVCTSITGSTPLLARTTYLSWIRRSRSSATRILTIHLPVWAPLRRATPLLPSDSVRTASVTRHRHQIGDREPRPLLQQTHRQDGETSCQPRVPTPATPSPEIPVAARGRVGVLPGESDLPPPAADVEARARKIVLERLAELHAVSGERHHHHSLARHSLYSL